MADITHGTWIKDGKAVDSVYQGSVKVYGRNLLTGTSSVLVTITNVTGYSTHTKFYHPNIATAGTYTARAYLSPVSHDVATYISAINQRGTRYWGVGNTISAGSSGYSTSTYTLPAGHTIDQVYFGFPSRQSDSTSVSYKEFKLEKGSVATPWAPAPEDVLK